MSQLHEQANNQISKTQSDSNKNRLPKTPARLSNSPQQHTPLRSHSSSSFLGKENEVGSNHLSASSSRIKINRRSILKKNPESIIRGLRQSVSFAKQKEIVTFVTEDQ